MPKEDQGLTNDRYMIIPRVLVFILHSDQVLLLKGASSKRIWANRYNGVGGHVERNEDVLSAARREIHEETGLEMHALDLCGTVMINIGDTAGIGLFVFRGNYEGGELIESREGKLEWVSLEELNSLPLVEDLPILLEKVANYSPGQTPFAAHYSYDDTGHLIIQFGQ